MSGNFCDGFSIYGNASAVHIVESHQKIDKCCFTAAGRTYNGNSSAWFCVQIEVFNQRFVLLIAEGNIPDIHSTFYIIKSSGRIRAFRLLLQKIKILVAQARAF